MRPTRSRARHSAGRALAAPVLAAVLVAAAPAAADIVFSTDFSAGIPPQLAGAGVQIESAQGLAGLGAAGNQFGGNVLRYHAQALHETTLTLSDLPPHTHVSLGFLLAVIDSWDGTELMQVLVDGQQLFSHWFQLATGDDSSYLAPAGALLSSGSNLGWTNGSYHNRDRAYDLSLEPAFIDIPHTASTLTVTWRLGAVSGGAAQNWQGGADESWAIDNLTVSIRGAASPAPLPAPAARLLGGAPNPFNPSTRIRLEMPPGGAQARLAIFDASGRLVRTLVDGFLAEGPRAVAWDGRDTAGRAVAAGVYVCRLATTGVEQATTLVLVK
jgi:hypothetical protein